MTQRSSSPRILNVGVLGLGSVWESRYQAILDQLHHRLSIGAVYDPVLTRAENIAPLLNARVAQGVNSLIRSDDLDAIVLLDAGWMGETLIQQVCLQEKPVYFAGGFGTDHLAIQQLHEQSVTHSRMVMPEFSRRYTPATSRLQELMATELGRPQRVTVQTCLPDGSLTELPPGQKSEFDYLVGLLDWCCYLIKTRPHRVSVSFNSPCADSQTIRIEYKQSRAGGEPPVAEIQLFSEEELHGLLKDSTVTQSVPPVRQEIVCQTGHAVIHGHSEITWTSSGDPLTESLTADRTEVEVMLDLFCRRVVGGLISTADLGDVARNIHLVHCVNQSRETQTPVNLNGVL